MQHKDKILLQKIILEINKILEFLGDETLEEFLTDEKNKYAGAMASVKIGEFIKNLTPEFRTANNHVSWKKFAGFRDIVAHRYDTLDMEQVYTAVTKQFPNLKLEIEKIIEADTE